MSYLSEVLADSPLGYWRLGDVNSTPPTAATASSDLAGSGQGPAQAIDFNTGTFWTTNATATGWLRLQFPSARVLAGYSIARRNDANGLDPGAWTFEGSNDGSSWTVLDTRSGVTWPTLGEIKSFSFPNSTAYTYYRINVSANSGYPGYLSIAEIYTTATADSSGNSRSGNYFNAPTVGVAGLVTGDPDTACSFNGLNQYVVVPYASWMTATAVTVEAIIKTTATTGTRAIASRDWGNRDWQFRLNAGKLEYLTIAGGAGTVSASDTTNLADGARHHVAATYDANSIKLYVDGVLVKTQAAVGALPNASSEISIGAMLAGGGTANSFFDGTIDEVAYYGAALSDTRIAAHAAAVSATPAPSATTGTSPVGVGSSSATLSVSKTTGSAPIGIGSSSATSLIGVTPITTGTSPVTVGSSSATALAIPLTTTTGSSPVGVGSSARTSTIGTPSGTQVAVGVKVETGSLTLLHLVALPGVEVPVGLDVTTGDAQAVVPLPGVSIEIGCSLIGRQSDVVVPDPRRLAAQWRYVITDLANTPLGELVDIEHDAVEDGVGEAATMSFTIATDSDQYALIKPIERQCQVWEGNRLLLRGPILPGQPSDDGTTITHKIHDPSWFIRDGRRVITRTPQKNLLHNGDFKNDLTWWTRGFDKDSIPAAAPTVRVVPEDFVDDTDGLDPIKAAEIVGVESVTEAELSSNAVFWPNLATFRPGGKASVEAVANAMPSTAGLKVTVVGHTANDGTGNGLGLSLRRAQAAAAVIHAKHPGAIITTKGVGFYDPKPGAPIGSQAQRRVVIQYDQTISGKSKQFMKQTVEVTQPKEARYPLVLTVAAMLKVADDWSVPDANMTSLKIVARRKGVDGKPDATLPWDDQLGQGSSSISDTDPIDRWIPQTAEATIPADGRTYLADVYLYAPAALARYTAVGLFPDEQLYFWGVDQASIFKGVVEHIQKPEFGYADLGIGTRAPLTGVKRDREFAFRDLTPADTALDGLMGISRGIEWDTVTTPTTTTATTFYPRQGKSVDYVLALGANVVTAVPANTRDVGSAIIAQAQGLGSYRAVAYANDTRAFGGTLIQRVITAEQDTPLNELGETAKAELFWARTSTPAYWVDIDPDSIGEVLANTAKGDTVRLILDYPTAVDRLARIVRRQIHPDSLRLMVAFEEV